MALMKKLVIFYSLDGNTEYVAKVIKDTVKADILKLDYLKSDIFKGPFKYFIGGMQVIFKQKPLLKKFNINLNNYDLLYIGTPVWAGSYCPPFNTFFADNKINNKNIALFSCYAGSPGSAIKNLKKILASNKIVGEISLKLPYLRETRDKDNKNKVADWAKNIERSLLMSDSKKKATKKPAAKKPAAKKPAAKKPAAKKPAAKKKATKKK